MDLIQQAKMLRFLGEILIGSGSSPLPYTPDRKPTFSGGAPSLRLPRSAPEKMGVPSASLARIYREIAATKGTCAHSLLIARGGHVISDGWFSPYRPGIWHVTHSLCKSFTGTAVGIAVHEGLFSLDDRVADYFPEDCTVLTSRRLRLVTVRQLLTMSSGITFNEMSEALSKDWVRGIFDSDVGFEPGSRFVYNSMNSYLLSALVKKTSGQGLVDFLTPRVFDPLGFGPVGWEKSPTGIEKGGWGMYLDPEDMLKFGQLYLQQGVWHAQGGDRQLIPADWVREATCTQITGKDGGYGYQIWTDSTCGSFLMNGMFGQYVAVFPKQQIVAVMTGGNGNLLTDSASYFILRDSLGAGRFSDVPVEADPAGVRELQRVLASLRFDRPVPDPKPEPVLPPEQPRQAGFGRILGGLFRRPERPAEKKAEPPAQIPTVPPAILALCGTDWRFGRSRGGLLPMIVQFMDGSFSEGVSCLRLDARDDRLDLHWTENGTDILLPAGWEHWLPGRITLNGETFLTEAFAQMKPDEDDVPVLKIDLCLPEHSSSRRIKLRPNDEGVLLELDESPSLAVAVSKASDQAENTGGKDPVAGITKVDYTRYRLDQLIRPRLQGTAASPKS